MKNTRLFQGIKWAGIFLVAAAVFLPGCSRNVATLDDRDFSDPLLRKAQSRVRQGDKDSAIVCLNQALERRPDLAQANLELAILYDDYKKDYVRAVYHYQRYLELRPAAQKRAMIEDRIKKATMSFAASISGQFPEMGIKLQALEEENNRLKASLREVRKNLIKLANSRKKAELSPGNERAVPVQQDPTLEPTATTYCVQPGDTLSLIAAKVYRDPRKWKTIRDANGTNLVSPDQLKSGQILTIPR